MKVLDRKEFVLEKDCPACKSKLAIEAGDIQYLRTRSFDEVDEMFWVVCAVCQEHITIPESKVPRGRRDALRDARRGYVE
jgi:hypothetical protein